MSKLKCEAPRPCLPAGRDPAHPAKAGRGTFRPNRMFLDDRMVTPAWRRQAQAGVLAFEYQDLDFKNLSIRVLISSLALRNTATLSSIVPIAIAGSSIDQWSRIP